MPRWRRQPLPRASACLSCQRAVLWNKKTVRFVTGTPSSRASQHRAEAPRPRARAERRGRSLCLGLPFYARVCLVSLGRRSPPYPIAVGTPHVMDTHGTWTWDMDMGHGHGTHTHTHPTPAHASRRQRWVAPRDLRVAALERGGWEEVLARGHARAIDRLRMPVVIFALLLSLLHPPAPS